MIDTGYLYSENNKRIFVNTSLGCTANCAYCYLKKVGYPNNSNDIKPKKAEALIKELEPLKISKNTLITMGCFSECLDDTNKPETIKLIKYFLQKGNQIQLSTKKEILAEEFKQFQTLIQYVGQLVIFVSSATISKWDVFENKTDSLSKRFNTFKISRELGIPTVLYMKPVLKEVTIADIGLYENVIREYNVKTVVVGSIFEEKKAKEAVPFLNEEILWYNPISDEDKIKNKLEKIKNLDVFSRSTQVMRYYKDNANNTK